MLYVYVIVLKSLFYFSDRLTIDRPVGDVTDWWGYDG